MIRRIISSLIDLIAPGAKGNLLASNGSAWTTLGVGSNGQVLTADSTQADGLKWAAGGGGGGTPGGTTGQFQYNNAGAFGGTAAAIYSTAGNLVVITAQADSDIPLTVQGHSATQTGKLWRAVDYTGTEVGSLSHDGSQLVLAASNNPFCIGASSSVSIAGDLAIGYASQASGQGTAFGYATNGTSSGTALGFLANASGGGGSVAVGSNSAATGATSFALGAGASATMTAGVAIGYGTTNSNANTVMFGGSVGPINQDIHRADVNGFKFAPQALSSTSTFRDVGYLRFVYVVSTDATYTSRVTLSAQDHNAISGGREGFRVESDGAQALASAYGVPAVPRAAHPVTLADVIAILTNFGLCS